MRKLYIVLHTLAIGGAERHASTLANYLAANNYHVTIILLDNDCLAYDLVKDVEAIALCNLVSPNSNSINSITEKILLKLYQRFSPQKYALLDKTIYLRERYVRKLTHYFQQQSDIKNSIVISFMSIPNIVSAMTKKQLGYNLVLGEFTSPHLEFSPDAPENQLKKRYFPLADGFVFQTEEQKSFYHYLDNVKKKIIPNPIEKISVVPYEGIRKKEIVNFCRLSSAKNLPLLIDAFGKVSAEYPDYDLIIYGEGPEKSKIEKKIEQLGLQSRVQLRPFSKNVLEMVRDSAMFVSSSDREGISNSMIEAMAIGLPTICTDCPAGGARMFIRPYENGILTPVGDTDALYRAMKFMIENPEKADQMGKNAVKIQEILKKERILSQWLDFISSIIENTTK